LQVFAPGLPLQFPEQHSEFAEQLEPAGSHWDPPLPRIPDTWLK
jgi:hypothetical protein